MLTVGAGSGVQAAVFAKAGPKEIAVVLFHHRVRCTMTQAKVPQDLGAEVGSNEPSFAGHHNANHQM